MQNRRQQENQPNREQHSWGDRLRPHHMPIAYKLALIFSLIITAGMGVLGLIITSNQSNLLEQQMNSYAGSMAKQLADSSSEPILANDNLALTIMARNLLDSDGVLGVAIYNAKTEQIISNGLTPETGMLTFSDDTRPFPWKSTGGGEHLLTSVMTPVRFQDHVVGYALLTFDRQLLDQSRQLTVTTIIAATMFMVLVGIIVAIYTGKRLVRPIHQLIDGSIEISSGNYQFRFNERRNDEIGQLMQSLNTMSDGLFRKEQIEQAFSRYVSPKVASELLNDLDQISLGGKHVEATVMFADIAGFTQLSEKLPPEEVNSLLNEYFTLVDKAALHYQGHVDKYMGDCAMLVFGVPDQDEEHCLHAISCALLIQRLIDNLNQHRSQHGYPTVEFRIGINSGIMLAGNMGSIQRMEYTVVGDAVNLASRLSSVANAGEIVVCKTVHDRGDLNEHYIVRESTTISLRGMSKPVATYVIQEEKDRQKRLHMDELFRMLTPRDTAA